MAADGNNEGTDYAAPRGRKMDNGTLKSLLDSEKVAALAAMQSSKLSSERDDALMYYMNDLSKDMPSQDGRSQAVSSDVADTIEGLLPQLMEIFAGSEEPVKFNPQGPEDVDAAQQETDYINHVFMNQNPGFLVLYSFIKDALLSKVGVVKVWWEEREEEEKETYYDLTDEQFAMITADEDVEITKHTEHPADPAAQQALAPPPNPVQGAAPGAGPGQQQPAPINQMPGQPPSAINPMAVGPTQQGAGVSGLAPVPVTLHDVEVVKSKTYAEAKVLGVPPEEFGIEKTARSIRTCNYCFHRVIKSQSELVAQGYDEEQIKSLPTYMAITNAEEINRDTVAEHQNVGEEHNPASRRLEVIEHYVRMDYEGDGKARLYKVTTGAEQGQLLVKDGKIDVEEFDAIPFAAMTPVIVTHRFFGRSIADLVMDIMRVKTALLRGWLDNQYLVNNPRTEVSESHASENTLDDLLISRPGGIVRTKQPGGLNSLVVPPIGETAMPMLEYMDSVREMRTGVTRQGQGIDAQALQNQSATAVNQMFTMAQARMKLVARIFAETGIKDLFLLLHGVIRKHGQEARTVRLNNKWVNVDPREWKKRDDMTVDVGLGTGGKAEQMAMINLIIGMQEKALMGGMTNLVNPQNLYNSAKELTRIAGKKNADAFFTDPTGQPPPQPQPDPKIIVAQMQMQLQQEKQQADTAHEQAKMQADAVLEQQKFEHEKQLAFIEMGMKQEEHKQKMEHENAKLQSSVALAHHQANLDSQLQTTKVQSDTQLAREKMAGDQENTKMGLVGGMAGKAGPENHQHIAKIVSAIGAPHEQHAKALRSLSDGINKLHESHAQSHQQTVEALGALAKHLTAPKRIIRDPKTSRAIGVESVAQ